MKNIFFFVAALAFLLTACSEQEATEKVLGLKPIYGNIDDLATMISTTDNQPMQSVGKIYVYEDKLLINEVGKGVHIFNNADPRNPSPLKFINIPGNVDVAIKDNYMYADLGVGLATIDITDLDNIAVTSFDQNHVNSLNMARPPAAVVGLFVTDKVFFECPDQSKGLILSWEKAEMPKPDCFVTQ